jgi:alkyl sulfatase BDS1-like metallo-beta-lactamase superfamily hydrolase
MKSNMMLALALAAGVAVAGVALAQTAPVSPKAATAATKAANQQVQQTLPFSDKSDFDDAKRGFMGAPETLTIKNAAGTVVWDLERATRNSSP